MSTPATALRRAGTFDSLRIRDYRLLWIGQIAHTLALWMEQIARPWLVLEMTGSGAHVGGVIAMRTLPQLIFGVWAGVIADWFDRRTILLATKASVLIVSVLFAALLVSGRLELWHIYAFAFIRGSFMAFDQPARQSMIASVVPADRVTNAVALMSATQNTMRIVGTSAAGFIIAVLGVEGAFIGVAAVYVVAVVATKMLHVHPQARPGGRFGPAAAVSGLVEGMRYASKAPAVRGVLLMSLIYFTFGMSYAQVFAPLFAERVLEVGPGGFGFMMSLTGVGALIGALFIASRQPQRLGMILPLVVVAFGAMLVIFTASTYLPRPAGLILPFVLIAITGTMQTAYMSLSQAMILQSVPSAMRGRAISLLSLDRAMVTLGASGAGILAEVYGVQPAQILYGVICIAGGLAVFTFVPGLRRARTTDFAEAEAAGAEEAEAPRRPRAMAGVGGEGGGS